MKYGTQFTRGWSTSAKIGYHTGPRNSNGCRDWLSTVDRSGYPTLGRGGIDNPGGMILVTRFIVGLSKGDKRVAMHSCDNPTCVEPSHLSIGTPADNNADRDRKGRTRHVNGEAHGLAKLTAAAVLSIRWRYAAGGVTYVDLAAEHGVTPALIGCVVRRIAWKHI